MFKSQMYGQRIVSRIFRMLMLSMILQLSAMSQQTIPSKYPPTMSGAHVEIYKTVGEVDLRMWIYNPEGQRADELRPAIVFFFGGGWQWGNPIQFHRHCEYLAARGMVAVAADYRVSSRHGVTANRCVEDAKSAIRWIRKHADRLEIDPNRIAAGGGSSGGHLAAATAILPLYDDPEDDLLISARPNALVLFSPSVVVSPISGVTFEFSDNIIANLKELMGVELESISPYHHVTPGVAPTIIFHGTADNLVPYKFVELFREKMKSKGNTCVLIGYQGAGHGFFNYGLDYNAAFIDTVNKMDEFLVSLGYLKGAPNTVYNK